MITRHAVYLLVWWFYLLVYSVSQTPLHLAVITQQKEAIDVLLDAGADASITDRHGNTALHLAAQQREGDIAAQLLRHRRVAALMPVPNSMGMSPRHLRGHG